MKKIVGNTIELIPVQESHIQALSSAWNDLRYVPHTEESKQWFLYRTNSCNNAFDWNLSQKGNLYLSIIDKALNIPIGYTLITIKPFISEATFKFTIIAQEHRELGRYSELNILRHKFVYQENSAIQRTVTKLHQNSERQKNTLAALYTREDFYEDSFRGPFIWSSITREEWDSWISDPAQEPKRNSTFLIQDI